MKKTIKYLVILFLLMVLPMRVNALEDLTLNVDKTELKKGETLTITIDLKHDDSLYAFTTGISFDENVFEVPEVQNFKEQGEWSDIVYNKDNNKFALINKSGVVNDHLLVIKLFVKENPVGGKTKISLHNAVASDGEKDISFDDVSKDLTIKGTTNDASTYAPKEDIVENEKTVQTFKPFIIVGLVVMSLLLVGIIFINTSLSEKMKFSKKMKKNKISKYLSMALLISLLVTIVLMFLQGSKGDVNDDGKKDYEDAKKINEYLIDIQNEKDNKTSKDKTDKTEVDKKKYDVNGDGKITITDTAQRVEKTTKTKYTVKLTQDKFKKYPKKKESIELQFTAKISPDNNLQIKEVYLDGKKVKVSLEDNIYSLTVKTPNTSGIKEYKITKVVLTNGREIDNKDLTFTVDVLKDVPKVGSLTYEDGKINYVIKDQDNALKETHIKIVKGYASSSDFEEKDPEIEIPDDVDPDDIDSDIKLPDDFETMEVVYEEEIKESTKNVSLDVELELGQEYTILITGNYDLDTNKLDSNSNYYENKNLYLQSFTNGGVQITAKQESIKSYYQKNEAFTFDFEASVKPEHMTQMISSVVIDGEEREVRYVDDHYAIDMPGSDNSGEKRHIISSVTLDDGHIVLCNYELIYEVLKDTPSFANFLYHEKEKRITFALNDEDNALIEAKLIITKQDDKTVVYSQKLDLDDIDDEFSYDDVELNKGSKYDVNIDATYDLDEEVDNDDNNYDATLFTHVLTVYKLTLSNVKGDTYYVNKNADVKLNFKADILPEDNGASINKINIGEDTYRPKRNEDGTYSVEIKAPDTAKIYNYTMTNVTLGDDETDQELKFNLDVLKDKPTIEELYVDETEENPVIKFNIIDKDNALLNDNKGQVIVKNKEQEEAQSSSVVVGENSLVLDSLTPGENYYFDIYVNYDLDSDVNNDEYREVESTLVEKHPIVVYDAKLSLEDNNLSFKKKQTKPIYVSGTISPNPSSTVKIKSFIMDDGTVVDATLNDGKYYFNLKAPDEAKINQYSITKVILNNDVIVNVDDLKIEIDVLKDAPYINNLNISEDNKSLTYELVDNDGAYTNGYYEIYQEKKIKEDNVDRTSEITKGNVEYDFQDAEVYKVVFIGTYDLRHEKNIDITQNEFQNAELYNHTFIIGGDYNFTLTDVSITDAIQKDERPVITFASTNTRGAKVESIDIDDKTYPVTNVSGNNYKVVLNEADMAPTKHTLNIDSIKLDTTKVFTNGEDFNAQELVYTVLKDAPKINNINLTNNSSNKTITATYEFSGDDDAFNKLVAILVDSNGNILDSEELDSSSVLIDKRVTLSYDKNFDGKYTVKFLCDYDLGDKYKYTSKNIGEATIFTKNDEIYIKAITTKNNNKYLTKGQRNFEVSFDVSVGSNIKTSNNKSYSRTSAITVNGVNYVANQESGYKSKIGITAPTESGVITLTANRVQLELNSYYDKQTNYYSVPEQSIRLEVLRDAPVIENLQVEENAQEQTVTFTFNVKVDDNAKEKDESFIDGSVKLGDQTEKMVRGKNTVTFKNVPLNKNLDLIFVASYDLDTDALNEDDKDLNQFKDTTIYQTKYGLFSEDKYNAIKVTDGKAISADEDSYFEKEEKVKLNFNVEGIAEELQVTPKEVIINDKHYSLNKLENGYEIIIDGYNTFGVKNANITDVILSNGKDVKLSSLYTIHPEVLKDKPKITDYEYKISDSKEVTITSKLKDPDGAVVGKAHIKVVDEDGNSLYDNDYSESIKFDMKEAERVYVSVVANYDRDTDVSEDSKNYNKDVTFLDEIISIDTNKIELKDIVDINLYKFENDAVSIKESVNISDIQKNKDNYFVEIVMENMPTIYAEIDSVETANQQLVLILKYKYVTKEGSTEKIKVDYGSIKDGTATNETHPQLAFKILLAKLQNNDSVKLTQDYDASGVETDGITYVDSYSGTLNGNGYTIKNLSKPLFNNMSKATIENITFKDVTMPGTSGNGTIAINDNGSTLTKVLVTNYYKANAEGVVGTLIGNAQNTTIEQCRAVNFNINSGYANRQQLGGLIGCGTNVTIRNSYAQGSINGGWNYRGGLSGRALGTGTYENNYVNVNIDYSMGNGLVCGFTCDGGTSTFKNNISLSYGSIGVKMFGGAKVSEGNYYIGTSDEAAATQTGVTKITSNKIDNEFFRDTLDFNETIWNLKNASYDNLPTLKFEKVSSVNKNENIEKYKEENETLYTNLTKLMPFYNSEKIINIAEKISSDSSLRTKEIVHILPVDSKGNIVTYLTTDNVKRISKIKIVYKEGNEHKTYKVTYDNTYDMVASYRIPDLKIDYNFNHYIIDANSQVVTNLTNYLKGLDYTENLDVLTKTADSRIYRDFYKETTSKELKEFVLKYLSNSNYTNTTGNEAINSYIEKSVKKDKQIEKVLYMYNYLHRFYDLEIEGMKLYDFMLFNMEGFNQNLTPSKVTSLYFASDDNFKTDATGTRYASVLGSYTNQNTIAKFLEYMVTVFGDGDLDEWTRQQFKGYLKEIPIVGHEKDVQYTLWDHFSNEDANYKPHRAYDMMLPILTLPKNAAYIISTPVQYVIGAQRSYIEDPEDSQQHDILVRRISSYANRMATYYATAYKILGDAKLFNDIHTFHLDKRYAYDENGALVYQQVGTEEPFHKNFNEVTNRWATSDGNAAVAWGDRIDWSAEGLMDGYIDKDLATELHKELQEYTYHTFTHETAHNIDARLFLKNYGRRFDAGGEDYADSNLMQSFGKNDIVMNLSVHYDKGSEIGSNWDPSRIDSPAEVEDYYKKVFETIYVIDYIEAQAFLQLNSEQKAEIGIQVSYPNEGKYTNQYNKFRARQTSAFSQLSPEDWDKIHLETIDDLINNRIMKYSGVYQYASRGSNSYGGEGINTAHWYQPNNPDGRPDSYALKWIAYEMLGYKGYQNGYVEYNSNIHSVKKTIYKNVDNPSEGYSQVDYKSDNMAISRITGGKYTNIDDYKKARFKETGEKLKYLKYIDIEKYTQELYDAMVKDSIHSKESLERLLKSWNTDDKGCLAAYWCRHDIANNVRAYPNSTKVRQEIYYKLKNETDDFTGDIFSDEVQNENINFQVKKDGQETEDINLLDVPIAIDDLLKDSNTIEEGEESNFQEDEYTSDGDTPKEQEEEYVNKIEDTENKPKEDEYIGSDGDPKTESSSPEEVKDDDSLEEQEDSKEEIVEDSIDSVDEEKKEVPEEETSSEVNSEDTNDLETDSLVEEDLTQ